MHVVRRVLRLARTALRLELTLYRALGRWLFRRPEIPPGSTAIGYSRLVAPMLWPWIFGSAVEVVVLDLVLSRWLTGLRVPLLLVGVWGLVWMLGMLAAYRTRPHLLGERVLQVRDGIHARVDVEGDEPEALLLVGVSSRTNLELVLRPTTLETPHGPTTVTRVGLWVGEPREVAELLRRWRSAPAR